MFISNPDQLRSSADAMLEFTNLQVVFTLTVVILCLILIWYALRMLWRLWSFLFNTIWFCGCGLACLFVFFCSASDTQHCPQPWLELGRFPTTMLERILRGFGGFGGSK